MTTGKERGYGGPACAGERLTEMTSVTVNADKLYEHHLRRARMGDVRGGRGAKRADSKRGALNYAWVLTENT